MNFTEALAELWETTGIFGFGSRGQGAWTVDQWGQILMIVVGLVLLYLAIKKGFEPLLLVPIGFGAILTNIPFAAHTHTHSQQKQKQVPLQTEQPKHLH